VWWCKIYEWMWTLSALVSTKVDLRWGADVDCCSTVAVVNNRRQVNRTDSTLAHYMFGNFSIRWKIISTKLISIERFNEFWGIGRLWTTEGQINSWKILWLLEMGRSLANAKVRPNVWLGSARLGNPWLFGWTSEKIWRHLLEWCVCICDILRSPLTLTWSHSTDC